MKTHIHEEHALRTFSFFYYASMAVIVSYFPLFFSATGYSDAQIGLLTSFGPLVGIASNLLWGLASDRFQTIKKLIIILVVCQMLAAVFLFQMSSFGSAMLLMIIFAFFQIPTNTLNDSQILLTAAQNGKSYAYYRVWGSIGFAFSAVVIGLVLKQIGAIHTSTVYLICTAGALLFAFTLRERSGNYRKMEFSGLFILLRSKKLVFFLLITLLLAIAHRANDSFLALFLNRMGADPSIVGWSWMLSALGEIPVFFLISRYGHKFKEVPLLALACFFYALRFALMSIINDPIWVIAAQLFHSVSFGIYFITALRYLQTLIPDQYRSTGQAVFTIFFSGFASLISGTLGGVIFQQYGPHTLYASASVIALLAASLFLLTHWSSRKTETGL